MTQVIKIKKSSIFLAIFSGLYLLLSFALYQNISHTNPHRDVDSSGYEEKAKLFVETGSFAPKEQTMPALVQQPNGYPLFLATIYKFLETHDAILIWIQIFLTLLSGFLLFFATRYIFDKTTALIAFALFCTNVGYITFSQFILSEALLTFFLILFLLFFLKFIKTQSYIYNFLAGLILGLSIYIKPAALYFIVPLFLLITFFCLINKKLSLISKIIIPTIFLITFIAPIATHVYKAQSLGNYNLYVWFWSKVETDKQSFKNSQTRNKIFFEEQDKRIKLLENQNPLEPKTWVKLKNEFYKAFFKNPYIFVKTWIREMCKTYLGLFTTNLKVLVEPKTKGGDVSFFFTGGSIFSRIYQYVTNGTQNKIIMGVGFFEFGWTIIKYLLVAIALLMLLYTKQYFLFLFFSSYLFYFAFVTGFDGCARYRTMFEFILIMLAARGIILIKDKFEK